MRASIIAMMLALAAPAVMSQQAPPAEESGTVPQARFEAEAESGAPGEADPRFVRAPAEGAIEVSPLAPPEGTPDAALPGRPGADIPLGQPGVGEGVDLTQPETGVDLLEQGAGVDVLRPPEPGEPIDQRRFRTAPEDDPMALTRPSGVAVPIDSPPTEPRVGVRLRELDKMTGQTETFEVAVGETRQVDRLKIRLEACRSPEANDTHGTIAFLKVWDEREPEEEAFSGWMFAESPSLSALDHPRYDLWVISCTTSDVAVSSESE